MNNIENQALEKLRMQEEELSFKEFNNKDAWNIGNEILDTYRNKVKDVENPKGIGVRISLNHNTIFQYLMEGKKDDSWLIRKENSVYQFEHSSLYVRTYFELTGEFDEMRKDQNLAICGGGFPIIINSKVVGVISVSGLKHTEDHNLIIEGIKNIKRKRYV